MKEMKMIEVYKTNVDKRSEAQTIVEAIRQTIPGSDPSIDLDDCDSVLRVECSTSGINDREIIALLENLGYKIEVLP